MEIYNSDRVKLSILKIIKIVRICYILLIHFPKALPLGEKKLQLTRRENIIYVIGNFMNNLKIVQSFLDCFTALDRRETLCPDDDPIYHCSILYGTVINWLITFTCGSMYFLSH